MADPVEDRKYSPQLVAAELERLCASTVLGQSERLKRFIRYSVQTTLNGTPEQLKESVVGTQVFDRPMGYNPKEDAIVRVEAHRLRQKLDQYYAAEGKDAPLRFVLPKGKYGVQIEVAEAPPETILPVAAPPEAAPANRFWKAVAGVALLIGLAGGAWYASRDRTGDQPAITWHRLTLDNGFATDPVLLPDGKSVIYSADRGSGATMALWRQPLDGGEPQKLTPEPYDAIRPDVSPDGQWLVYGSRDPRAPGIYRRLIAGGTPQLLVPGGLRPRYSPDGRWISYTIRNEQEWQPGRIGVVPAQGGAPIEVASDFADAHFGIFSEDSSQLLFCGTKVSNEPELEHDWWIIEVPENNQSRNLAVHKTTAFPNLRRHLSAGKAKIPPNEFLEQPADWLGNFIYFSSPLGNPLSSTVPLWRLALNTELNYTGETPPERLSFGANADLRARARRYPSRQSNAHRAVVASGTTSIDIWRLPLQANAEGRLLGGLPVRATSHTDSEIFPAPSPNGRWLAYAADRQVQRQIYLRDLETQVERLVSPSAFSQDYPILSPDSTRVAFRQNELPAVPILMADTATKKVERVCQDCGAPTSWSPDGQYLLYEPGATIAFVGRFNLTTRQPEVFLRHPEYSLRGARYSPDGRWIAFYAETSREGRRIYVAPAMRETPPSEWIPITTGADIAMLPAWSEDSRQLFFLDDAEGQRTISGQRLNSEGRPQGAAFTVQRFSSPRRSLLRLTRTRVSAVGLSVRANQLYFALDEQLAEIFWADLPPIR
ncbi:MAG: hypothetical protein K2X03_14930 [Bryobacteraceae bacterium]|nr:hypothetical protein [Bryobacteraceae bacterium]